MRALDALLIAVIYYAKIPVSNGSTQQIQPKVRYKTFHLAQYGETVPHRVIASSLEGSTIRCAGRCLKNDCCRQFCYGNTTGQCVLEDVSVAPVSAEGINADNCTYFTRKDDNIIYHQAPNEYLVPYPAFGDDAFELDFAVQAKSNAKMIFSTDDTKSNAKYHLVLSGYTNTWTTIQRCPSCDILHYVKTQGLLSELEMRRFWLRYDHGTFALGKYKQAAFFEWTDPKPPTPPPTFLGFTSWIWPQTWAVYDVC